MEIVWILIAWTLVSSGGGGALVYWMTRPRRAERESIRMKPVGTVVCPTCKGEGGFSEPRDICRDTNRLIEHWFCCDRCQGERYIPSDQVTVEDLMAAPVMSR
jgi:hypothetical protein